MCIMQPCIHTLTASRTVYVRSIACKEYITHLEVFKVALLKRVNRKKRCIAEGERSVEALLQMGSHIIK